MNRSILIIIVDFLLVTLVAFSNFDTETSMEPERPANTAPKTIGGSQDLMGTLKLALEDEKQSREKLTQDLQTTEQALAEREQRIRQFQADLRKTEEQAKQLDQQRTALAQQVTASQASLEELQSKLAAASTQNVLSEEKLAALQADLKKREEETQSLQNKLSETEKAAQAAMVEKQQLTAQLQVSEAEKRLTREQVAELRTAVVAEKQEKARIQETATVLATNVGALAAKSSELTQEIRDNRALAPNTIFNQFLTNRITAKFEAVRSGLFGRDVTSDKLSQCILFTDGSQTYTLFHVEDTPVKLWNPGTDWNRITAVLQRGNIAFSGVERE
jgi:myosin heavy subunit